ncbi:MAG: redoxin domain-containing protein [Candidatus Rokubacteria bacterium]|nr:redoxin domain-containing protein [Candidatus Rokubacteria bacterium]
MTGRRLVLPALASLLPAVALAAILLAPPSAAGPDQPLAVGDRAPDFALRDQDGKTVRLSELLARRPHVVLAFYVKAFTPG